jgi:hypothetical protein
MASREVMSKFKLWQPGTQSMALMPFVNRTAYEARSPSARQAVEGNGKSRLTAPGFVPGEHGFDAELRENAGHAQCHGRNPAINGLDGTDQGLGAMWGTAFLLSKAGLHGE